MIRYFLTLLLISICSLGSAQGEEGASEPTDIEVIEEVVKQLEYEDGDFFTEESMSWVETKRRALSGDIVALGEYIDSLMGDIEYMEDHNKSYVRLYFGAINSRYEDTNELYRVKFSLDLPVTKKKLRFILESENDELDGGRFPSQDSSSSELDLGFVEDSINATFRFLFETNKWDRLSFDWGIKARLEPDLFSRARGIRSWTLSDTWTAIFYPELFWFDSRGAGVRAKIDFDRLVKHAYLFRIRSTAVWHERTDIVDYHSQVAFYQDISRYRAIEYSIGLVALNENNFTHVSKYYSQIRYRRNLYKGWLFYQMSVGTLFQREFDFRTNPFIGFRIEILLSDDLDKGLTTRMH
jgi:hypothetical protein